MISIKAIYSDGAFRPIKPAKIEEGTVATVLVEDQPVAGNSGQYTNSFGILPAADAVELATIIEAQFEQIDEEGWK